MNIINIEIVETPDCFRKWISAWTIMITSPLVATSANGIIGTYKLKTDAERELAALKKYLLEFNSDLIQTMLWMCEKMCTLDNPNNTYEEEMKAVNESDFSTSTVGVDDRPGRKDD